MSSFFVKFLNNYNNKCYDIYLLWYICLYGCLFCWQNILDILVLLDDVIKFRLYLYGSSLQIDSSFIVELFDNIFLGNIGVFHVLFLQYQRFTTASQCITFCGLGQKCLIISISHSLYPNHPTSLISSSLQTYTLLPFFRWLNISQNSCLRKLIHQLLARRSFISWE